MPEPNLWGIFDPTNFAALMSSVDADPNNPAPGASAEPQEPKDE